MFSFSYILWHKNKTCYGLALGSFMRFSPSFSGGVISVMSKPDIRTLTWQNQQNTKMYKLDFSSIVTGISHGVSVNSNGIVCLCIGITGNTDCRIYINDQEIGRIRWQSGFVVGTNVFPIMFPVSAGANITVSGLGSEASISNGYLIPYTN